MKSYYSFIFAIFHIVFAVLAGTAPSDGSPLLTRPGFIEQAETPLDERVYPIVGFFQYRSRQVLTRVQSQQEALGLLCSVRTVNEQSDEIIGGGEFKGLIFDNAQPVYGESSYPLIPRGTTAVIGPTLTFEITQLNAVLIGIPTINFSIIESIQSLAQLILRPAFPVLRLNPSNYDYALAVYSTLQLFNWTVIAEVFSYDLYGLSALDVTLNVGLYGGLVSTCSIVVDTTAKANRTQLVNFVECLSNKHVNVVLIWASIAAAAQTLSVLHEYLPQDSRVTFILLVDTLQSNIQLLNRAEPASLYKPFPASFLQGTGSTIRRLALGSLIFTSNPGPVGEELKRCRKVLNVRAFKRPQSLAPNSTTPSNPYLNLVDIEVNFQIHPCF